MKLNLSSINLNLLVALDALLNEINVTHAAEKVNTTQSNMSKSLKQLRELFDDDLLVKNLYGKMRLTPKAKSLKLSTKKAINNINNLFIDNIDFDQTTKYLFNIGMTDYTSTVILPYLLKTIYKENSNIKINILQINDINSIPDNKIEELDFIFTQQSTALNNAIKITHLFSDKCICVADKNHPGFQKRILTANTLTSYPHLTVKYSDNLTDGVFSKALQNIDYKDRILVSVPNLTIALKLLTNTEFIGIIPLKMVNEYTSQFGLTTKELPSGYNIPVFRTGIIFNPMYSNSPAHQWLSKKIRETVNSLV